MNNHIKYYIRSILYSTAIMFTSVSVMQIFMDKLGIGSVAIGVFTSLLSAVNVVTSIMFSGVADSAKNIKGMITRLCVPIGICTLLLVPIAIFTSLPPAAAFAMAGSVCLVQVFFVALFSMFEYKLPYSIIDMRLYGRFVSVNGIITGIFNALASYVLSEMIKRFDYFTVMAIGFAIGGVCALGAALVNMTLVTKEDPQQTAAEKMNVFKGLKTILGLRTFRFLIIPNFLRGIHMGMISVGAVIAIEHGLSQDNVSLIVTVTFAASLLGSVIFSILTKRIKNRTLCLVGTLITPLAFLMCQKSEIVFLLGFFLAAVGKFIVDYAVPSRIYEIIDPKTSCLYHTWRLIITTAGTMLSTAISGLFLENMPIIVFISIATACQIISGICYFSLNKNDK